VRVLTLEHRLDVSALERLLIEKDVHQAVDLVPGVRR
jgi:hypothetical protein